MELLLSGHIGGTVLIDDSDQALVRDWHWVALRRSWQHGVLTYAASFGRDRHVTLMHRLLMGLSPGDGLTVDHINGNGLDNRRSNLRVVTLGQNLQNRAKRAPASSIYRGVYWNKASQKWRANARLSGHFYHLGYFDIEEDAAEAARIWREAYMPFQNSARAA